MENEKIIKLNINTEQENIEKQISKKEKKENVFQTNPIKEMLFVNVKTKKGKLKLKDLFK